MGIAFVQEAALGRYCVDFLLPDSRVALEVDGTYWHQDGAREARRDRYIAKHGWRAVHVLDSEIENVPDLTHLLASRIALPLLGSE